MIYPLTHPAFHQAIAEIESLGIRVADRASFGATPYAIVGGRSNARWWLIPLSNRHVTISSMALYQPIRTSAKVVKHAAVTLSRLGLRALWARPILYLSGESSLARHFGEDDLSYAYFTGTDSPHRKVAVQTMDVTGQLRGFAKVSMSPCVRPLLQHEAETLGLVNRLNLSSALVPKVLFAGEEDGTQLLVTDTQKTPKSTTSTDLLPAHVDFLRELASKTTVPIECHASGGTRRADDGRGSEYAQSLIEQFRRLEHRLPAPWSRRLADAIGRIDATGQETLLPPSLTHGDFTPWNTCFVGGKLYVFDWEYAKQRRPISDDLIHFLLAAPRLQHYAPTDRVEILLAGLRNALGINTEQVATAHLLVYLAANTLRYMERSESQPGSIENWRGENSQASLFDVLLNGPDR